MTLKNKITATIIGLGALAWMDVGCDVIKNYSYNHSCIPHFYVNDDDFNNKGFTKFDYTLAEGCDVKLYPGGMNIYDNDNNFDELPIGRFIQAQDRDMDGIFERVNFERIPSGSNLEKIADLKRLHHIYLRMYGELIKEDYKRRIK